jgi:MFS family permease
VALLLLGGVVVDRVPRRLAMLASDLVRGAAVATIAVLVAEDSVGIAALVAMAVVFGTADAFFSPASTAVVPELLPSELLVKASALSTMSRVVALQLIGPAVGGVIVAATGTAWAFGLDAASFAISGACLVAMSARPRPSPSGRSILADAREGLSYCRSQPWLWVTIAAAGFANFALWSPLGVLIPLLVRHVLDRGAASLGLTLAAGGAGGLAGVIFVGRRGLPRRPVTVMWGGWIGAGAVAACVGLAPRVAAAAGCYAVAAALLMYSNALWTPLMQRLVPQRLLGRASSVDWLVSIALSPLGIVASGAVAASIGTRQTIVLGGLLATASGLCLLVPGVRDPDRDPLPDGAPGENGDGAAPRLGPGDHAEAGMRPQIGSESESERASGSVIKSDLGTDLIRE